VKGLTTNLISISQLCDQGLKVIFSKSECLVIDIEFNVQIKGERSKNDCYLWKPREESKDYKSCQFMSVLRRSNQTISRASKLSMNPVEELQSVYIEKEEISHILVDRNNFDRKMYILEDIYQRHQRRIENMRNMSSQPNDTNGPRAYIYWTNKADIRNLQEYNMSTNMLE